MSTVKVIKSEPMNKYEIAVADAIRNDSELTEIKTAHAEMVEKYNEARIDFDGKTMAKLDIEMDAKEKDYEAKAKTLMYRTLRTMGDDMMPAIMLRKYSVISRKDEKTKESTPNGEIEVKVLKAETKEKHIDLKTYDAYCAKNFQGTVSANAEWWKMVEEFNKLLTASNAKDICAEFNESKYFMSKNSNSTVLGKDGVSKTHILKSLQKIVDAIIYVEKESENGAKSNLYKALSHDVNFITKTGAKKSKKVFLGLEGVDHKDMTNTFHRVLYRIVTGEKYEIVHKQAK